MTSDCRCWDQISQIEKVIDQQLIRLTTVDMLNSIWIDRGSYQHGLDCECIQRLNMLFYCCMLSPNLCNVKYLNETKVKH